MPSICWMIRKCTANGNNVHEVDSEQRHLLVESVGGTQAINDDSTKSLMLEMMEIGCIHVLQEFNILISDVQCVHIIF